MFFNRFKPEKAHEELKKWLLSLRSKYENVNGMSHLIAVIDDEIENIDYVQNHGTIFNSFNPGNAIIYFS